MYICLILCFFLVGYGKFCVLLQTSSSKTQMLFLKKNIFLKYILFCSRFITFTTLTLRPYVFCLSFVNNGPRSGQNFQYPHFSRNHSITLEFTLTQHHVVALNTGKVDCKGKDQVIVRPRIICWIRYVCGAQLHWVWNGRSEGQRNW